MLIVSDLQLDGFANERLLPKLEVGFRRHVPGFADWNGKERADFLQVATGEARLRNLTTEVGIASYALGVWWLNVDFDQSSSKLQQVLRSRLPEVRRVHAMNEWISVRIGRGDLVLADQALAGALETSSPWGISG